MGKYEFIEGLRGELTGYLVGLAKSCSTHPKTDTTTEVLLKGIHLLGTQDTGEKLLQIIEEVEMEQKKVAPGCGDCKSPCGNTGKFDMKKLLEEKQGVQDLKLCILEEIVDLVSEMFLSFSKKLEEEGKYTIVYKVLSVTGYEMEVEDLSPILTEIENIKIDK